MRQAGFGTADLVDAQGVLANKITVLNDRVRIHPSTRAPALAGGHCSGYRPAVVLEWATGLPVGFHAQTSTPGLTFQDAWRLRETMDYQSQKFYVASRQDLLASKRAAGHPRDLEDVRVLELAPKKET